jgi:hypothetical protein
LCCLLVGPELRSLVAREPSWSSADEVHDQTEVVSQGRRIENPPSV